ncbi:MAG: CpsD/CapB family tyrosine-protein kinase [Candidatus Eisenbacteria bacterium]|nr:CpsD/CapB family tyrosine-protein kinase [Candidatus Eisenbacteria bacterium]
MSKISDALDKADRERRGRGETPAPEQTRPELGPALSGNVPDEFWRELGMMRNLVESHLPSKKSRSLLVTSTAAGEGVSSVTANFGKVLADDPSLNVLVVDANPGAPAQHEFFGIDNANGFVELARGVLKPDEAARATVRTNLSVIPSGAASGGMLQLAGAERVVGILAALQARFNYVLLDAPPVLSHPETAVLGSRVDGVLLVVRALNTRREVAARARDTLARSGCNVIGVVLNRYKYSIPEFIYRRV